MKLVSKVKIEQQNQLILEIFLRQWLKFLIFVFFCFFTVMVGVYLWPETYESSAKIIVKLGRENVALPTGLPSSQQFVSAIGVRKEDINSEIEIIRNRVIIENTVLKLGTDFLFPTETRPTSFIKLLKYNAKLAYKATRESLDDFLILLNVKKRLTPYQIAVLLLEINLSAKQVTNSDVIDIRVKWFSPEIAREVLKTLIEQYLELHLQAHSPEGGYHVLQNQVADLESKLSKAEDQLQNLKKTQNISSIEEQKSMLLKQLSTYQSALQDTQTEIAEASYKIKELKTQRANLLKSITPGFNTVIKEVEKELLHEEIRAGGLSGKKEMLGKHVRSYQNDLEDINSYDVQIKRLNRQIAITEDSHNLYRKKLEDAKITKILDSEHIVNVKIIEPAIAPIIPIKPKKMMIIGIGAVVSLILGACLVFLLDKSSYAAKPATENEHSPPVADSNTSSKKE